MAFQQREHALGVRLRRAVGEGDDGDFHAIHAGVNGGEVGGGAEAGGVVRVQGDGKTDLALQLFHELVGDLRLQDAGHVLDPDGIAPHLFQLNTHLDEILDGVDGADGVAQLAAGVFAVLLGGLDGGLQVADVIQGVKNTEDVLAVGAGAADEGFHDVVGKTGVLHDVLAAQQHELGRLGRDFLQGAQAVEGVLIEEPQAGVNGGAAPGFEPGETHLIEDGGGFEHLGRGHAGGGHGLVAVPEDRVIEKDRFGFHFGKKTGFNAFFIGNFTPAPSTARPCAIPILFMPYFRYCRLTDIGIDRPYFGFLGFNQLKPVIKQAI